MPSAPHLPWPFDVVFPPSGFDLGAGEQYCLLEAFVAEAVVEALVVGV